MHGCAKTLRRLVITLVALALSAGPALGANRHHAAGAARTCPGATRPAAATPTKAVRRAVVCLINVERTTRGLPALKASPLLNLSAQRWTNVMVATRSFWHGVDFAARITAVGFMWRDAGENIATGFETPRDVVSAWMASPDHCQNILDPRYTKVGTGLNRHPVVNFASGPSTWTQDFALPMLGRAPSDNYGPQRGCPYKS